MTREEARAGGRRRGAGLEILSIINIYNLFYNISFIIRRREARLEILFINIYNLFYNISFIIRRRGAGLEIFQNPFHYHDDYGGMQEFK